MLKIRRLELRHFCQHSKLDLDFQPGLIGLVGRNGSGKTTISNALRGALTGVFKRYASDTAAGCIQQGQFENASVTIGGELAGTPFTLHREIGTKAQRHRLYLNDELFTSKANEIELWLTEASGLTPQMMTEFMFIPQQELYAFLDATDAERSKKFAALCGTKIFERMRDGYLDMLKTDKTKVEAVSEAAVEQLEQQLTEHQERLAETAKQLDETQKEYASHKSEAYWKESIKCEEAFIKSINEMRDVQVQITAAEKSIERLRLWLKENKKEMRTFEQEYQGLNADMNRFSLGKRPEECLAFYTAAAESNRKIERVNEEQKTAEEEIAALTDAKKAADKQRQKSFPQGKDNLQKMMESLLGCVGTNFS